MLMRYLFTVLLLLSLTVPAPAALAASGKPTYSVTVEQLVLTITEDIGGKNLGISLKGSSTSKADAFTVSDPGRIVIDLPSSALKRGKNIPPTGLTRVSLIRIGVHPDKVRIVLDLTSSELPSLNLAKGDKRLDITASWNTSPSPTATQASPHQTGTETQVPPVLSPSPTGTLAPTASSPTGAPTSSPVIEPSMVSTATPSEAPTRTLTAKPTFTRTPTPVTTPTSTPTQLPTLTPTFPPIESPPLSGAAPMARRSVSGLHFEYAEPDHSPFIRISLSEKSEYRFVKEKDKSYKITISRCALGVPSLALPQFPPNDFTGFTWVQVKENDGDIDVMVGVDDNTRVSAIPKDSDIIVKTLPK